ncbi:MAG: potassium-transporting ATPase subunit KdpA [Candidatus Melainabacteria bacterium]|nr:MAG: potassium-transporting ATPase subunit KdpA [Candidatus Melainabacteria bacterium]
MSSADITQLLIYVIALTFLSFPLGLYMADVYDGKTTILARLIGPFEKLTYRLSAVDSSTDMNWKQYAVSMLLFNTIGLIAVYALQRLQPFLPLNPQGLAAVSPDSALNTAISFASNTNWQGYSGEQTLSYLTQMLGLTVQNFVSAATGMAVLASFIRAFARQSTDKIGNFWVDLVRTVFYILLPLSIVLALALVSQGTVQTFNSYAQYSPIEAVKDSNGAAVSAPLIALGPAASQVAIKQLGTNGGGFFNVNSSHPLENPTPLSNFLEALSILIIPAGLCWTFGKMVGQIRQGAVIYVSMFVIFLAGLLICTLSESAGNPLFHQIANLANISNMEGKEVRFGIFNSTLWATATTVASNGSVNSMHDSLLPMAGMIPMLMIQLGEVVFGGVGSGLYGMLVFALITVFIAGLMVGRTPEYLGKKIEAYEVKMASLIILIPPSIVLVGTAIAVSLECGLSSLCNHGAHGFSEILYAFSSAGNNNGSAFAGLNANTPFYNVALGIAMWYARFWLAVPALAIAGSLVAKKTVPKGAGTLPTDTGLFVVLLISVVIIFGALTFFPALALGPIVEQLQMVFKK